MNTCPNCGKIAGLHSSILQGCMCQYSMQAPPKKEWVGLTIEERTDIRRRIQEYTPMDDIKYGEAVQFFTEEALKEKNG